MKPQINLRLFPSIRKIVIVEKADYFILLAQQSYLYELERVYPLREGDGFISKTTTQQGNICLCIKNQPLIVVDNLNIAEE